MSSPLTKNAAEKILRLTDEIYNEVKLDFEQQNGDSNDAGELDLRDLRRKVRELQMTLYSPKEAIFAHSHYLIRSSAVRALMKMGVVEALVTNASMTAAELAKAAHFDNAELITRLLRSLVAEGIVFTADGVTFESTPYLEAYISTSGDRWLNRYNEFVPAITALSEYIEVHNPKDIQTQKHSPHSWVNGQEGDKLFDIIASDPERLATWHRAMTANEGNRVPALGMFPWQSLLVGAEHSDRTLIVDVGGGLGQQSQAIVEAHPAFKGRVVVQDLPKVMAMASKRGVEGLKFMPHNFYTPQPIRGAKAYYFCRVLHNFYDDRAVTILKNTIRSMEPDSRILIADQLMPDVPSFGELDDVILLDYYMLVIGGKERTEKEFEALVKRAGLQLVQIWKSPVSYQCIVEAKLARRHSSAYGSPRTGTPPPSTP